MGKERVKRPSYPLLQVFHSEDLAKVDVKRGIPNNHH